MSLSIQIPSLVLIISLYVNLFGRKCAAHDVNYTIDNPDGRYGYRPTNGSYSGNDGDEQIPKRQQESLEVTLLMLFIILLLSLGVVCSIFSICSHVKCRPTEVGYCSHGHSRTRSGRGLSFEAMLTRSPSYFREDLLNDEEMQRLWICFYCDFANYEMKAQCALCGNEKQIKDLPVSPRSKAQAIRPASLFGSVATTLSQSSSSLSSSFLQAIGASPYSNTLPHSLRNNSSPNNTPSPNQLMLSGAPSMLMPSPVSVGTFSPSPSQAPKQIVPEPSLLMPPSPSGTLYSMLQRRREWQPSLNLDGKVVWEHHDHSNVQTDPNTAPISQDIITRTAFVSHNEITHKHPHGKLRFVDALGAQVYGSTRPEYYKTETNNLTLDPFAVESIRKLAFPEKHRWFIQETNAILGTRWNNSILTTQRDSTNHGPRPNDVVLFVPRDDLFHGTMQAIISVSQKQLHRPLRVRFMNEPGVDAGGIVREWFGLVIETFLDSKQSLFQSVQTTSGEGLAYTIHPSASIAVADYLLYYRAFGRLIGKALLEGHLISVPLTDILLKHMLSVPISFVDLQAMDNKLAKSLQLLWETPLDSSDSNDDPYDLDFSVYDTSRGIVDLKPNGRNIIVTEENKHEYIALFTRWHLGKSMAKEVAALVSGLYDVIPVHLLAPFDYHELRLMLCGSPVIDIEDWEAHTFLMGKKHSAKVISWFWHIVRRFTDMERCRLLQFATGATRVPIQGFKALTSSDGRLCPFTLQCLPREDCPSIRAFTCFNRLDLPIYKSEKELERALRLEITDDVTGFTVQ